uniref:Uncharacterized protein n=1 Tax=Gronococcus sybilensis TaxID=3028029 RepID=A0A9Y1MWX7_9RHOD|nr:hypothetical protein GRSY_037 [Gronococcus sybilensis]
MSSSWPKNQGLLLDQYVAFVFTKTLYKCKNNVKNYTDTSLPLDILEENTKKKLLIIVLNNLEKFIVELKSENISKIYLTKNRNFLLLQFFHNSLHEFCRYFHLHGNIHVRNNSINKLLCKEAPFLLEIVCIYLIFGDSANINNIFHDTPRRLSYTKVTAFIENLTIKISNAIMLAMIKFSSTNLLTKKYINLDLIQSIREYEKFKNFIILKDYMYYIFFRPRDIYNGYYQLWIIKECGLDYLNIHVYRIEEFKELEGFSLLVTLWMELQDLFLPQLKFLLLGVGKAITYVFNRLINKFIIYITKSIRRNHTA